MHATVKSTLWFVLFCVYFGVPWLWDKIVRDSKNKKIKFVYRSRPFWLVIRCTFWAIVGLIVGWLAAIIGIVIFGICEWILIYLFHLHNLFGWREYNIEYERHRKKKDHRRDRRKGGRDSDSESDSGDDSCNSNSDSDEDDCQEKPVPVKEKCCTVCLLPVATCKCTSGPTCAPDNGADGGGMTRDLKKNGDRKGRKDRRRRYEDDDSDESTDTGTDGSSTGDDSDRGRNRRNRKDDKDGKHDRDGGHKDGGRKRGDRDRRHRRHRRNCCEMHPRNMRSHQWHRFLWDAIITAIAAIIGAEIGPYCLLVTGKNSYESASSFWIVTIVGGFVLFLLYDWAVRHWANRYHREILNDDRTWLIVTLCVSLIVGVLSDGPWWYWFIIMIVWQALERFLSRHRHGRHRDRENKIFRNPWHIAVEDVLLGTLFFAIGVYAVRHNMWSLMREQKHTIYEQCYHASPIWLN